MTDQEVRALIARANAAGFDSIAEYAANLEGAFLGLMFNPGELDSAAVEDLAIAALGKKRAA